MSEELLDEFEHIMRMDKEIEVLRSIIRMQLPVLGEDDENLQDI